MYPSVQERLALAGRFGNLFARASTSLLSDKLINVNRVIHAAIEEVA